MRDDRALKEVVGKVEEQYCFCVTYRQDGELYGMYVCGSNAHTASEDFLRRMPGVKIKEVKLSWPR